MKMGKVIAKRFIFMIPVVLAVTFIIFMLSFISAGDAARVLAGKKYEHPSPVSYTHLYTLKMSYKTDYKIDGFFEYVVPPLEGFWWQDNVESVDYTNKSAFNWISIIRMPDFIAKKDFDWAVETACLLYTSRCV